MNVLYLYWFYTIRIKPIYKIYEIIDNSIDEYLAGYCNEIIVAVKNDNTISVQDNGRGVPFGKAEDGSETLVNVYTKLHTGAKFDSSGKTGYNTSGGMNGVGAKPLMHCQNNFKSSLLEMVSKQ